MFWSDKIEVDNIRSWHFIFIVFFLSPVEVPDKHIFCSEIAGMLDEIWVFRTCFDFMSILNGKHCQVFSTRFFSDQVRWVNVFPIGHQGASEKDQNGAGLHQPVIANWRKRANAFRGSISAGLRSAGLLHLEVLLVPIALLSRHFTPAGLLG